MCNLNCFSIHFENANLAAEKINATAILCIRISSISSSFNANIWSLRWIHRVDRIRTDLAENLSGSRILRGIDIWGGYIASRDLQKSLVQNWVAGIFVRTTAGTINCEFLPPSSPPPPAFQEIEADSNCGSRPRVKCRGNRLFIVTHMDDLAENATIRLT